MFRQLRAPVLLLLSLWTVTAAVPTERYQDRRVVCQPGEHLETISRSADGALHITCRPFSQPIGKPNCTVAKPLQCNGVREGCPIRTWLSGFEVFPVDDGPAEVLTPICCSSTKLHIDANQCSTHIVRDNNQKATKAYLMKRKQPTAVYQSVRCYLLKTRSEEIRKVTLLLEACNYGEN